MQSAYMLIETEVGRVAHVAQALTKLDGVQLAEDLAGPYDVIAKVQAPSLDELGRLVVSRIQILDGVSRTMTCIVLHR
jgi:DNA-binding Lrp family transcriptional regulator